MRKYLENLKREINDIPTAPSNTLEAIYDIKQILITIVEQLDIALPIDVSDDD